MRTLLILLLLSSPASAGPLSRAVDLANEWGAGAVPIPAEPVVADGWYYIEAMTCATCPSAKGEIAALVKSGWTITLIDESHEIARWAKPATLPAVIGVSRGDVVQRVLWPFDRWDVSAASTNPQRQAEPEPEPVYQTRVVPTFTSPSYTHPGDLYGHLLGPNHRFSPAELAGLSYAELQALHNDSHSGRVRRVRVEVSQSYEQPSYQRQAWCPPGG